MKKQNVRTLGLIVCTLTYLLIGAAIFDSIESEEERRQKEALENLEAQMLGKYKISKVDYVMLEELIHLDQPFKAGMPWKFAGSFYYATTVLTTIGYGHSTPKTDGGKLFTIVYATIGIPLGLVMFNSIGERLNNFSSIVINKLRKMCKAKQNETSEMDLILVVSSLSGIVATIGAAVFSHYEGWSYFHSIYYCFVTLTTIGFGDFVALQQDNSLEIQPEYVTFALFFIMFGLAIIAASLNLMVLKFMTMNTEDERRDEQQAIQAAAQNVRLDGDVILQQSEVLHWQAEGAGSMEEIRSVCSCTCQSCNPFQQINARYQEELDSTRKYQKNNKTGAAKRSRRYSESSILTDDNDKRKNRRGVATSISERIDTPSTIEDYCDYRERIRRNKANSVHDLRRSTVSSVLRFPSESKQIRPNSSSRNYSRAASAVPPASSASAYVLDHSCGGSRDDFAALLAAHAGGKKTGSASANASGSRTFLKRMLRWPPQLIVLSPNEDEDEDETEIRRESYALDEVNAFKVVPKSRNLNHHKRVSL